MRDRPLLVDDVQEAARHLSPLGQSVVEDACQSVRAVGRAFATARGWTVVDYSDFARWVESLPLQTGVTLDPLFRASVRNVHQLRISRILYDDAWRIELRDRNGLNELGPGAEVTLIDDVAVTGSTLQMAHALIEERGAFVRRIALCGATTQARTRLESHLSGLEWLQYTEGGHGAIHLRDACPYLPFSGRPSASHAPIVVETGQVPVRLPSIIIKEGLWAHVFSDYRVLAATIRARSEVSVKLSDSLGREATVADLQLLGEGIALPAYPRHQVTASTTLSSLN